jgi:Ca2+:H+ antiporter
VDCCQITILAIPFSVVYAWIVNQPLTLDLLPLETAVFAFTVIGAGMVISDGRSTWLKACTA